MKRILVTGASGALGWNVCAVARASWQVHGIVHRHAIDIPGVTGVTCDLSRPEELPRLFREIAPDAVVHCAAAAQPDFCQTHPDESRRINVEVAARLAALCAPAAIPCACVSTDLVFDGTRAPYREGDPVSPISVYGEQKAAAERAACARHPGAVICRLPPIFGDAGPASVSFLHPWVSALRGGRPLTLFVDEFRTPVGTRVAAAGLLMALETDGGTLHLGGRERVSRYDLGVMAAEMLGADPGLVLPGRQRDRTVGAPRPPDVSLDSSRAYALGYDPPPLREALRAALRDLSGVR
jgi:dTDP-4-dehydrorhamnose reductase